MGGKIDQLCIAFALACAPNGSPQAPLQQPPAHRVPAEEAAEFQKNLLSQKMVVKDPKPMTEKEAKRIDSLVKRSLDTPDPASP